MLNVNGRKNFTSCGDKEAEELLGKVLSEMNVALSGTGLCVVLGGSYGRGDGGVRLDRENGILYNDLDFFVFAAKASPDGEKLLKELSEKYEKELKVDVDFSRVMTVNDIKNNAERLMMQELKRGYVPVCGKDLLAEYLPEIPAEKLPFSEACRLLLNRGMGLYLAGEKICNGSADTDFILRNIYKCILGTGDAMLIASGEYRWKLSERLEYIENSSMPEDWKFFYREGVQFKRTPDRKKKEDMISFWNAVRDFYREGMLRCAGVTNKGELKDSLYERCRKDGEISLKNYIKYCIKFRALPFAAGKIYTVPAVAAILPELYAELDCMPEKIDRTGRLFRHWQLFN